MIISPQSPQKEKKWFGKTTYSQEFTLERPGARPKRIRVASMNSIDAASVIAELTAYEQLMAAARSTNGMWRADHDGVYAERAQQKIADMKGEGITVRGL